MTTPIVKIILPSLWNTNQDPPSITDTLNFFNSDVLPLFKKMQVASLQNLNTFDLDLPKIQGFLTRVLTQNNISTFAELKYFRDKVLPIIPKALENEIMKSFSNLSFLDRGRAVALYPAIIKKEKELEQALPNICAESQTSVKSVKWLVGRLLIWAIKNYQPNTTPIVNKETSNQTNPNSQPIPTENASPIENANPPKNIPTENANPIENASPPKNSPTQESNISSITSDEVAVKIIDRTSDFFEQNKKSIIIASSFTFACLGAFAWYKFSSAKQKRKI